MITELLYIPQTEISSPLSPPTGNPGFESVSLKEQQEEETTSGDEQLQVTEISAELQEYLEGDVCSQKGQFEDTSINEFEEQEAGKETVVSEEAKEAEDSEETCDQFCLQVSGYHAVALNRYVRLSASYKCMNWGV